MSRDAPVGWSSALVIAAFTAAFFAPLAQGRTFSTVPGHQGAMWPWAATPSAQPDGPQSDQTELGRRRLVVERDDVEGVDLGSASGALTDDDPSGVRLARHGTDRLAIDVSCPRPGWLVVPETWDPGWTATVNGEPAPLVRSHVAWRAVAVPAGRSEVLMTYRPVGLVMGTVLSALTAACLGGLLVLSARREVPT